MSDYEAFHGVMLTPQEINYIRAYKKVHTISPQLNDLPDDLPYRRHVYRFRTALHNGQLKLLLGEIQFLTLHGHRSTQVVYVGAAPGTHLPFLAALFPSHVFHLWDPTPFRFKTGLNPSIDRRLIVRCQPFNPAAALLYLGQACLLISDVYSGAPLYNPEDPTYLNADMQQQWQWCTLMQPCAFQMKFRLPYMKGITNYLAGTLYIQCFDPNRTAECRLIGTDPSASQPYDHEQYERRHYFRNTILREWAQCSNVLADGLPVSGDANHFGVDRCFDCALMASILEQYCSNSLHPFSDPIQLLSTMCRALMQTGQERRLLLQPPHGIHPERPMVEKREDLCAEYGEACRERNVAKYTSRRNHLQHYGRQLPPRAACDPAVCAWQLSEAN
eukprot:NODE_2196_length_1254_cov_36.261757_g2086_i0.p1 GENE.NODE_2196_length_1254_cov_36.261757_g2086_i0~~NODE_2196_length_1254_cov_36.261757_g2086_i0.p1  ORF type:complete len:388 (+),score=64.16 NODE_2196_length_1254_cov_36.261757_g2086_i0:15-1178(+)